MNQEIQNLATKKQIDDLNTKIDKLETVIISLLGDLSLRLEGTMLVGKTSTRSKNKKTVNVANDDKDNKQDNKQDNKDNKQDNKDNNQDDNKVQAKKTPAPRKTRAKKDVPKEKKEKTPRARKAKATKATKAANVEHTENELDTVVLTDKVSENNQSIIDIQDELNDSSD